MDDTGQVSVEFLGTGINGSVGISIVSSRRVARVRCSAKSLLSEGVRRTIA